MMEAGDYPAGSEGAAWSTSGMRRRANGVASRHRVKQYANFIAQPRPGDRESLDREARGKTLPPSVRPGRMPPSRQMHENANSAGMSAQPNMAKHAADIHKSAEGGIQRASARGAPRTVAVQAGRDTNRGGNRVSISKALGGSRR